MHTALVFPIPNGHSFDMKVSKLVSQTDTNAQRFAYIDSLGNINAVVLVRILDIEPKELSPSTSKPAHEFNICSNIGFVLTLTLICVHTVACGTVFVFSITNKWMRGIQ